MERLRTTLLAIGLTASTQGMAQECCAEVACAREAAVRASNVKDLVSVLGPSSANAEVMQARLERLKREDRGRYQRLYGAAKDHHTWLEGDHTRGSCFEDHFEFEDLLAKDWFDHVLRDTAVPGKRRSPEFRKEWALQAELGQGAMDLFGDTERFLLSGRSLLSRTFGKEPTGNRIRAMLGPAVQYSARETYFCGNARLEFRLGDLGPAMTNIGAWKITADLAAASKEQWVGIGPGVEVGPIGAQLLVGGALQDAVGFGQLAVHYRHTAKQRVKP